jgi:nicotinamide-nucleotide amidase
MPHPGSASAVIAELRHRGHSIAVAESITGGDLCARLIDVPGASDVVLGGVVAYSTATKSHLLGVDAQELATMGPVTEAVAVAMATGVKSALEADSVSDFGVATTGVAGPDPDPATGQPAGLVFIAVSGPGGKVWTERLGLMGDRTQIRQATVALALGLLERALELPPSGQL